MKSPRFLLLFLVALWALGPLGAAPENTVVETRLPNGLTVLTKEVHSAPLVQVMVFYKVGSRNEGIGQTGMSHLLEHMLFKGTRTLKPGEIDRLFDLVGAQNNAFTSSDMTVYHETLAAPHLELALKIEADRMVNSVFDPAEHKREMTVVRSELEGGESSPDRLLYQAVTATAFQAHPYRWPVIGWRADVENTNRNQMYAYYRNWYAPNNAVLVIAGDFQTDKALALVRRYFGKLPARPIVRHFITPEPPQRGERRVVVRRAGSAPRVQMAYRIPRFGQPDYYALEVAATLLSGGRSARLFQNLVETGLATSAYAYAQDTLDPSLLHIGATAQQGKTAEDVERALLAEVARLQRTPVDEAELARAKNQVEAAFIFARESIPDQAETLGFYAVLGDWRYPSTYVARIKQVTAADVQRVARTYLIAEGRTVGHFIPAAPGEDSPAAPAAPGRAQYRQEPPSPLPPLPPSPPVPPLRGAGARAATPRPTRTVLPNGVVLIVQENKATPTVSVAGSILSAGGAAEPGDKPGLAAFTAEMLERGTRSRTSLQIAQALEEVGASVGVSANTEYLSFSGRSLTRDLARLLEVLSDELRRPSFPADQIEKLRAETLSRLAQETESPRARAARAFAAAVFPPGHPYHQPTAEAEAGAVRGFSARDLAAFHAARYAPNTLTLVVVGDVDTRATAEQVARYFGDWERKDVGGRPAIPTVSPQTAAKKIVIPMADKAEVNVVYGYAAGQRRDAPDFYAARVLSWILGGGSFGSRLMYNVRDRLGLVYGIYANIDAGLGAGPFTVSFGTNPANADKAVAEMRRQIARLRADGVTSDELTRAKNYITGSYPIRLATNAGVAGQLLVAEIYRLGLDYPRRYAALFQAVTRAAVNTAAKRYLDAERGTLVLAGPYRPETPPEKTPAAGR